jgi:hypothetical protein
MRQVGSGGKLQVIVALVIAIVLIMSSVGGAMAADRAGRVTRWPIFPIKTPTARPTTPVASAPTPAPSTPTPAPAPATPTPSAPPVGQVVSGAYYVAPNGNDANNGSASAPWATLTKALPKLKAGQTLYVRGGTYVGDVIIKGSSGLQKGTANQPITVTAFPGENPLVKGIVHLSQADYWIIDNIDVTWPDGYTDSTQHMFRFYGGTGWELRNSEVWGAHSFAAVLVNGGSTNFKIDHNYIHDTTSSNDTSQDHLIYVSNGSNGVIEYNLLVNAPNGRGVKLGNPSAGSATPSSVIVRYNTMTGNGSGNVGLSYDAHDNNIYGNIMVTAGYKYKNVDAWKLTGKGNKASANVGWDSAGVYEPDSLIVDGGGNLFVDPQLDSNYVPHNPALFNAQGQLMFGHLAQVTR